MITTISVLSSRPHHVCCYLPLHINQYLSSPSHRCSIIYVEVPGDEPVEDAYVTRPGSRLEVGYHPSVLLNLVTT